MTSPPPAVADPPPKQQHAIEVAPQRKLVWWRFRRHRLAMAGLVVVGFIYLVAAFGEFLAPSTPDAYRAEYAYAPPQRIHFSFADGFHVYDYKSTVDKESLERTYTPDPARKIQLELFARGAPYELWGLIPTDIHFLGPACTADGRCDQPLYLAGADRQGRDLLSRTIYGTRISMSIGLIGVALSLLLGVALGGLSGYLGGTTDNVIQRIIEFLMSIPTLPLWLGLAAAVPSGWGPLKVYFAITVILSLVGWTDLARVVRGRFLQLRGEDFVLAAELDGVRRWRVVFRHMLPSFTSHVIASLTLAIPAMILAETALSFLGLGLQPPVVSWGVLLQEAQSVRAVATAPWLMLPGAAVVVSVLALNFVGDGLRDSADPYAN